MANRVIIEKEIKEYCVLNNIKDVSGFITQCIVRGFNIFKYGTSPGDNIKRQNGDIVDNGSNRERKKKESDIDTIKIINKIKPEITDKNVGDKPIQELINNEPVVIRKKRKITVTNIK